MGEAELCPDNRLLAHIDLSLNIFLGYFARANPQKARRSLSGCTLIAQSIKYTMLPYEDLGPEAVAAMEVEDFPAIVVIDSAGNNYYEQGQAPYREL